MTARPMSTPPRVPRTHVWFRTRLSLKTLAARLGVEHAEHDCENVWEWFIGRLDGLEVDVCRPHEPPRLEVDTCLFLVGGGELTRREIERLIARLHVEGISPVHYGQRIYVGGDDYEYVAVDTVHRRADGDR